MKPVSIRGTAKGHAQRPREERDMPDLDAVRRALVDDDFLETRFMSRYLVAVSALYDGKVVTVHHAGVRAVLRAIFEVE